MKTHYDTLSTAFDQLKERGFTADFEAVPNKLLKIESQDKTFSPQEVIIEEIHRFEGTSNPADTTILYAITAKESTKGILLDAYGADSSSEVADFIKDVELKK